MIAVYICKSQDMLNIPAVANFDYVLV